VREEAALNIIFDLGGVVVRWNPQELIAQMFTDPAVQARVLSEICSHADWLDLDRGTLSRQEAIARAVARTGLTLADVTAFLQAVPAALVAIPDTVQLLYRLKAQGHRLFCLSNMHVASIEHLDQAYDFWEVFEGRVISCHINLIKPEPAIYRHLLTQHGLDGADTVFIDDVAVNLQAAARFGIRTIQFENAAQCERQLKELGCL
jgi:putative hydrolase of the HAD superfamily